MKSEWKYVQCKDIIEFNPKTSLHKGVVAHKIAMEDVLPFTKHVTSLQKNVYNGGTKFLNGDTILARITPCLENGKTAYIDCLDVNEVAFGSTEFVVMRAKPQISDSQFIYYLAISPNFKKIAIGSMVGSSGRQRVQQSVLESMKISVPPIKEQQEIGRFLTTIDDKIRINSQINDNLAA